VCVCVRAHAKTKRSEYTWVYVLSSWPVKGSLTSLIMGVNICRGLKIKSNWLEGCQHCEYFSYNYIVVKVVT
jgi:hypothetical protein